MGALDAPPDATPFRSRGKDYYLYMGALELRALQREWGLTRTVGDTSESWATKQVEYMERLKAQTFEDKLTILRVGLSRWAEEAGVTLTDRSAADIFDGIDRKDGKRTGRTGRIARIMELADQFWLDAFGGDEEEDSGPKAETTAEPQSSELVFSSPNGS